MYHSMSGTCSSAPQKFRKGYTGCKGSNSRSANNAVTLNPWCSYSWMMALSFSMMVGTRWFPRGLTVVNFRFLEMVSRKGTSLIYMISIASAIKLYSFNVSGGTGSMPLLTCGLGYETVFPFSDRRLVPYISSAASMPAQLIEHPSNVG